VKTAFVLSGGGSLGAVQVGMLAALFERGLHPDLLIGTSVGALNAAYLAAHGPSRQAVEDLGAIWRKIRRRDVFPLDPVRQLFAFGGRRPSLCSMRPLQQLVETHLGLDRLEDARVPVHVVTTDVMSGEEILLSDGDAISAVLASAAIPAVFPPVHRQGRVLVDGGVADNTAVSQAVALGAERVLVIPAGFACALSAPPTTALAAATHALTLVIEQRLIVEIAALSARVDISVLPPLCPLAVSPTDFTRADELISRAYRASLAWLDSGGLEVSHPERFLSMHHEQPSDDQRSHDQPDAWRGAPASGPSRVAPGAWPDLTGNHAR
jgi:NTE family protein